MLNSDKIYKIFGKVINKEGRQGLSGLIVRAWDKDLLRDDFLSEAVTDADGSFRMQFTEKMFNKWFFDRRPDLYFKIFLEGEEIHSTEDSVLWNFESFDREIVIAIDFSEKVLKKVYTVSGMVKHQSGVEVAKLVVKTFLRALGKEETLGLAVTNNNGKFTILYLRCDPAPDLFVRVYPPEDSPDKDKTLAVSEMRFAAKPEENFALLIDEPLFRGPSEFEQVATVVGPLLKDVQLGDLTAEDVALLAGKTGQNFDHVTRYVSAGVMAEQAELPHQAIYGLLRRGFGPSLDQLLAHDVSTLTTALEKSSEENTITLDFGKQASELAKQMDDLRHDRSAEIAPGRFGELLAIAGLDESRPADRKKASDIILAHRRGEDLWKKLDDAGFENTEVKKIRLAVELGQVTAGHVPLVKAIFEQNTDIALADIAWYTEQTWNQLFNTEVDGKPVGVPEFIVGDTPEEKRANYVQFLFTILEAAVPTAAIGAAMARTETRETVRTFLQAYKDFDFASSHVDTFLQKNEVAAAEDLKPELEALQRAFRIAPVHERYTVMDAVLDKQFDSAHKVARQSQSTFVTRMEGKISKEQAIGAYRKARLFSALTLTAYMVDAQGQIEPGLRVLPPYKAPWEQTGAGHSVQVSRSAGNGGDTADIDDDQAGRIAQYRTLFGSLDFCACEHCRSVLSPSAYFVDLLHWLERDRNTKEEEESEDKPTPLDKLLDRRPDLQTLQLSCENTDTLVPYVDLVNEVLENAVAKLNNKDIVSHDASLPHSDELLSTPQYLNAVAYDILADILPEIEVEAPALYPARLPFDLWGTQARVFLKQLGVERWKLMEAFARIDDPTAVPPTTNPTELEIATELLGMSTKERELITNTNTDQRLWGYGGEAAWEDVIEPLCRIPTFLERAGLSEEPGERYVRLLDLLHTTSANPESKIQPHPAVEDADICNICHLILRKNGNTLQKEDFHQMQRFIRLWRRLDWTMLELDKVLIALNKTDDIDNEAIKSIADIHYIQKETNSELLPLLSWWAEIDTKKDRESKPDAEKVRSLYEELFLNPALGKSVTDTFRSVITGPSTQPPIPGPTQGPGGPGGSPPISGPGPGEPGGGPGTTPPPPGPPPPEPILLKAVEAEIQAALGITGEELNFIKEAMFVNENGNTIWNEAVLNLENLSLIYRVVSLSRALELKIKEALDLRALVATSSESMDPFIDSIQVIDTARARKFVDEVNEIRNTGFSPNDLLYLLGHDDDAVLQLAPGEERMALMLADLRTGLQQIRDELAVEPDPTGEQTRKLLLEVGVPEHLEDHTPEAVLDELINIIAGISTLEEAVQIALVENHLNLGVFLDTAEAIEKLVNNRIPVEETSERFYYVQSAVAAYLRGERLVEQSLATVVDMEVRSTADFLKNRLRVPSDPNTSALSVFLVEKFVTRQVPNGDTRIPDAAGVDPDLNPEDQEDAWTVLLQLHKTAFLFARLDIAYDAQVWLFEHGIGWGLLDPRQLPIESDESVSASDLYPAWKKLADFFRLNNRLPGVRPTLSELLTLTPSNANDWTSALCERTGWSTDDVAYLLAVLPHDVVEPLHDPTYWHRLTDCFEILRRVAKPAEQVDEWRVAILTQAEGDAVRMAVRSRYEHTQWLDVAKRLQDQLREQQRAALVAYLVANEDDGIQNPNDLYGRYLIDVEMSPCAKTSRVKQAISSVQLFVQRCFLGLEDEEENEIELDADDAREWKWRGHYRIWEANRKVFLYPENWTYPELRRDKSQFFEELESELLQNEINEETVENAYLNYLEKLNEVARLDVRALYHQKEDDEESNTDILHVFGRTSGRPYRYFYRQAINGSSNPHWTPWERVDIDIEEKHLVPIVHNRRLILCWPIFTEQTHQEDKDMPLHRWLNANIAWSERFENTWSPKRVSQRALKLPEYSSRRSILFTNFSIELTCFQFEGSLFLHLFSTKRSSLLDEPIYSNDEDLIDHYIEKENQLATEYLGTFNFDECKDNLQLITKDPMQEAINFPPGSNEYSESQFYNFIKVTPPLVLPVASVNAPSTSTVAVLDAIPPGPTYLIYPRQYKSLYYWTIDEWKFRSQTPFFFEDKYRTFFVIPKIICVLDWGADVNFIQPGLKFLRELWAPFSAISSMNGINKNLFPSIPWLGKLGRDEDRNQEVAAPILNQIKRIKKLLDEGNYLYWQQCTAYYTFSVFYHPFVSRFITEIRRNGIDGLLAPRDDGPSADLSRQLLENLKFFNRNAEDAEFSDYKPKTNVLEPYPFENIDFNRNSAYSIYNWELFFYTPFLIASRLSQDQRFEDAMKWFHYIFEPMNRSVPPRIAALPVIPGGAPPLQLIYARYWKVKPFIEEPEPPIHQLMQDSEAQQRLVSQIKEWEAQPFDPHLIAQLRPVAYKKAVVIKYLDNLIAWGDQLFRQDSIESINQATQHYILAAEILGPRPEKIPPFNKPLVRDFKTLHDDGLDYFSNTLQDIENLFTPISSASNGGTGDPLPDFGPILYFCIPQNAKLVEYWNTIEDRLFKIRHCMNIKGIVRELPLFQPPIDPGLLVRATAAGVDLSSVLSDLNAPLPHYRFNIMLEKAKALNSTVRQLGGALLSALEKRDAEELSLLRSTHEQKLLKAVHEVRKRQVEEAEESLEGLRCSESVVQERIIYYQGLIDEGLSDEEENQSKCLLKALLAQLNAQLAESAGAIAGGLPQFSYKYPGPPEVSWGGLQFANVSSAIARLSNMVGTWFTYSANKASIKDSQNRRTAEWNFQIDTAEKELENFKKQIIAAEIRLAIAEKQKDNHELQIENAEAIDTLMRDKFTNKDLYNWMVGQISTLYFQSYQLAYDIAKRAEKCYRHELARPDDSFIQFGHWDSLKKGLLAGDRLQYDLERLETAYLENDKREHEPKKNVSLAMLNPVALVKLRQTGSCEFQLPEALFDLDQPGHYMRRIKSVSLSIPAVTGPYMGINGMLILESSAIRRQPQTGEDGLEPEPGIVETVAISSGQNDSGLFELSHNDPRYLPFERRGVVSQWRLELTSALPEFDRQTINDVILHLRYTARDGGKPFRDAVKGGIKAALSAMKLNGETGLMQLFSMQHHFPNAWHSFLNPGAAAAEQKLLLEIGAERFPYLVQDYIKESKLSVNKIDLLLVLKDPSKWGQLAFEFTISGYTVPSPAPPDDDSGDNNKLILTTDDNYGGQPHIRLNLTAPQQPGNVTFILSEADIEKLDPSYVVIDSEGHHRLSADAVENMIMVMHYTIQ